MVAQEALRCVEINMRPIGRMTIIVLALVTVTVACAPPSMPQQGGRAAAPASAPGEAADSAPGGAADSASSASSAPKRIALAVLREQDLRPTGTGPQRITHPLIHQGLTGRAINRERAARLAEQVATLENGLWKLLPDGRMETTWKLRQGARWHDGTALTTDDLVFSLQVGRDREMTGFSSEAYAAVEGVTAADASTLTITWKEPYIDVNTVLGGEYQGGVLPKHLLEEAYLRDKASFLDLGYWSSEFVGAGPYRVREFTPSIGMQLEAFDHYVLGRPKIDHIEVKYIPDANTLSANMLAGTVDVVQDVGSMDLALQLRDQWRSGRVIFNYGSDLWVHLVTQFVDPHPAIIGNVQFRRAMAHAINRQEMADTLIAGLSPVAHTFLSPNQPQYREIEATVRRYEYDPRRTTELLEGLGYRKGTDGVYRDQANQRLEIEVRSPPEDGTAKAAATIADYWQRVGVDATTLRPSAAQFRDQEWVSTLPGYSSFGGVNDVNSLKFMHSSYVRLPSNNFRVPGAGNRYRYMNAEFDALQETFFRTVQVSERIQLLGEIIRHHAEVVAPLGLYYNPRAGGAAHRVTNVGDEWPSVYMAWNAHEWDVSE
jgi:peptide/nickel transport system substrate-binding protein